MGKTTKDCVDKINQLNKERKPIVYIEIKLKSFDISDIGKTK